MKLKHFVELFKSKRLLIIFLYLLAIFACVYATKDVQKSEVEWYSFFDTYSNATVDLENVTRPGIPFKFLFANAATLPFSFDIKLGNKPKVGPRSLWVYSGQAENHGYVSFEDGKRHIGVVDNKLLKNNSGYVLKLSYVGDLVVEKEGGLRVTNYGNGREPFYSELGLAILAPQGMPSETIFNILNGKSEQAKVDIGLLLVVLIASYMALVALTKLCPNPLGVKPYRAFVLCVVCLFSAFYFSTSPSPPPLSTNYEVDRTGFLKTLDLGVAAIASKLDFYQRQVFPSRQITDNVPVHLRSSSGSFETKIFHINSKNEPVNLSSAVFFGKLAKLQSISTDDFTIIFAWVLFCISVLIVIDRIISSRSSEFSALAAISALSIFVSIRISEGWDEFFINLRHAYMLLNNGVYSVNSKEMLEATVDLVPILITSILGFSKISLVDAFVISSLLGNIVVILFSYKIVTKLTRDRTWSLISALLIGLYPNVVWVGGSGFSAVLFSGCILASGYFLLFTNRRFVGLFLLSVLTLVRTEGILFAIVLFLCVNITRYFREPTKDWKWRCNVNSVFVDGIIIAVPFFLSLIVRFVIFGHPIPNPVAFKNTNFDTYYLSAGINRFSQMICGHDLHLIVVVIVFCILSRYLFYRNANRKIFSLNELNLIIFNVAILIFIVPYYIGGGDWFPASWNRYAMPFTVVVVLTFFVFIHRAFFLLLTGPLRYAGLYIFFGIFCFGYYQTVRFQKDNAIYSTLSAATVPIGGRWQRVDQLASVGAFLKRVTPNDAVIASPEEATVMYFSEREMLGLLGVSNPDMTNMPFQPISPGDLLHRRRGHESIYHKRPDVIALYEPVLIGDFSSNFGLVETLRNALQEKLFDSPKVNVSYYRVGSFLALEKMGYRHITISYADKLFSLFVGQRIYENFEVNIKRLGFSYIGSRSIEYAVNPDISTKYVPSAKEMLSEL